MNARVPANRPDSIIEQRLRPGGGAVPLPLFLQTPGPRGVFYGVYLHSPFSKLEFTYPCCKPTFPVLN